MEDEINVPAQAAKALYAAECRKRGHKEAEAYYTDGRCPDDQTDITVVVNAVNQMTDALLDMALAYELGTPESRAIISAVEHAQITLGFAKARS
jgi:hypothetical protein